MIPIITPQDSYVEGPDGAQYRNLTAQVQKNKEDIAAHYNMDRVLANFGIRVIGQVASESELPNPETFEGEYGDAYAVGAQEPYTFYIWTRADVNAGHPNDYWFDVGRLAIIGPAGPKGDTGAQGPQGVRGNGLTPSGVTPEGGFIVGDSAIALNGDIYSYKAIDGSIVGIYTGINLRGPEGPIGKTGPAGPQGEIGPQGPKGDTGDPGGFIHINGEVDNIDQLPSPESLNDLTLAYLVGANKLLYLQVGDTPATAQWTNFGQLNVATYVTSGGEFQNVWNADTKLAAPTSTKAFETVPLIRRNTFGANPADIYYTVASSGPKGNQEIVRRNGESQVLNDLSLNASNNQYACVNVGYANDTYAKKPSGVDANTHVISYVTNAPVRVRLMEDSNSSTYYYNDQKSIPVYVNPDRSKSTFSNGVLISGTPKQSNHVATKGYVDNKLKGSALTISPGATSSGAIPRANYGQTYVSGKSITLTFTANNQAQTISGNNHIVVIFYASGTITVLVMTLGALGNSTFVGTLNSGIAVANNSETETAYVIHIPTQFN